MDANETLPLICASCDHKDTYHDETGCWFSVVRGRRGRPANCPCSIVASDIPNWIYDKGLDDIVHVSELNIPAAV